MPGNQNLIAHAALCLAVGADAGDLTGSLIGEALFVHGGSDGPCPGNGCLQSVFHLVHTGYHQNILGAIDNSCHPVALAVNVDHLAIQTQPVGAGEEKVRFKALPFQLCLFLGIGGLAAVDCLIIAREQSLLQTDLLGRQSAAPSDFTSLGDQFQGFLQCLLAIAAIIGLKMSGLKILHQDLCPLFVILLFCFYHMVHSFVDIMPKSGIKCNTLPGTLKAHLANL